jgi:hypothetical protein
MCFENACHSERSEESCSDSFFGDASKLSQIPRSALLKVAWRKDE